MKNKKSNQIKLVEKEKKINGGILVTKESKDGKVVLKEFSKKDKNNQIDAKFAQYNDKNSGTFAQVQSVSYSYTSTTENNKKKTKK